LAVDLLTPNQMEIMQNAVTKIAHENALVDFHHSLSNFQFLNNECSVSSGF
jgi:hypothetical protein